MLGSSSSRASNVNARLRYMFGWLGKDDITVVRNICCTNSVLVLKVSSNLFWLYYGRSLVEDNIICPQSMRPIP